MLSSALQNTRERGKRNMSFYVKSTVYNIGEFVAHNKRLLRDLNTVSDYEISSSPLSS